MIDLRDRPAFRRAWDRLGRVRLNPRRHTAANAREHSEAVAARAVELARANGATPEESRMLEELGRAHDIGKITGTARPERSLEVLRDCGIGDPDFLALVGRHDTGLPWFLAARRGDPPSDRAWRRLAAEVDLRLLVMFMVADRVDAPAGWRGNAPTVWFLEEARRRGLLPDLVLDLPEHPSEIRVAGILVHEQAAERRALLVRRATGGWFVPEGAMAWDETPRRAAIRLVRERAGVDAASARATDVGHRDLAGGAGEERWLVRVRILRLTPLDEPAVLPMPDDLRERRWVDREEAGRLRLEVGECERPLRIALDPGGVRSSET